MEGAQAAREPEPPYDAVVLGAGLAGLGAARTLAVFGYHPVVVEARERDGGRAHTSEFPAVPELGLEACPVEEGCNYLHGCEEDHVLFVIARRLGLPTAVCPSDLGGRHGGWESQEVCEWRDPERGGEQIPTKEVLDAYFLLNHVLQGVACVLPELESGGSQGMDSHAVFEEALRALLPRLAAEGVRSSGELSARERGLLYSMRGRLLGYVAPAARMPAAPLAAELGGRDHCEPLFLDARWPGERFSEEVSSAVRQRLAAVASLGPGGPRAEVACSGHGEDRLLLGAGFRRVVEALASGLEVIHGDPAALVQQGPEEVSVRLASGRTLRGLLAVVTLPTGVLAGLDDRSAVEFQPPLPEEKLECIRNLSIPHRGAFTHEKVVLRWGPSAPIVVEVLGASGASLQFGTTDRRFHFLNLHKYGRTGQLLCHIWADAEWRQHGTLSDEEVVAEVVAALRAMFPGRATSGHAGAAGEALVGDPGQWTVTRWAQDPFALGAYSELQRPGARDGDRQVYSRTEGRVLFAGEGAVPAEAGAQCTHGALLSGASAAVEAMVRLHAATSEEPPSLEAFPAADLLLDGGLLGLHVGRVAEVLLGPLGARAPPERKRQRHS